jgi:hypothetical protein
LLFDQHEVGNGRQALQERRRRDRLIVVIGRCRHIRHEQRRRHTEFADHVKDNVQFRLGRGRAPVEHRDEPHRDVREPEKHGEHLKAHQKALLER